MDMLVLWFVSVSQTFSLPVGLLPALCYVESAHNVKAINHHDGGSPSRGICQVKYETAKMIGFKGTPKQLMDPKTNIYYAGKYLASQLERYDGDIAKGVAAYNAGKYRVNARGQTMNRKYVAKVMTVWLAKSQSP